MSLQSFAFENLHKNVGGVVVGFQFDLFETAEADENFFGIVRVELELHGFDSEAIFIKFFLDIK